MAAVQDGQASREDVQTRRSGAETSATGSASHLRAREGGGRAVGSVGSVVVVEDETTLRRIIARNLTSRGIRVREAASAAEALRLAAESPPDLLLLDINLPDRSGWDVLRELRRRGIEVPTIVVSAVQVSADRLREFRPLCYLPKPFPIESLLRLCTAAGTEETHSAPSRRPSGAAFDLREGT